MPTWYAAAMIVFVAGAEFAYNCATMLEPFQPEAAISLAGMPREHGLRQHIEWAANAGFRSLVMDGGAPGARARDLDRGARRDLAATLRRRELGFAGVDLWIPRRHFESPDHQDRAVDATAKAIELVRDLASLVGSSTAVVSVALPEHVDPGIANVIAGHAARDGVTIADHTLRPEQGDSPESHSWKRGLDPATELLAGRDPAATLLNDIGQIACARLSDADQAGRVTLGDGSLDLEAYRIALQGVNWRQPVIIDVRGLPQSASAAEGALQRWEG